MKLAVGNQLLGVVDGGVLQGVDGEAPVSIGSWEIHSWRVAAAALAALLHRFYLSTLKSQMSQM